MSSHLSKQDDALLTRQRKKEDEALLRTQADGGRELGAARYARMNGATQDMKTMGYRKLIATADVVAAIAEPTKRKFTIAYEEVTEAGVSKPKIMRFTNILEADEQV